MIDARFTFALVVLTMIVSLGSSGGSGQQISMLNKNAPFPYQKDILPRDVLPQKYHLWMKPNTDGKTDFCGEVTIELKCVHSTRYLILHSTNLNITDYSLYNKGSSQPVDILSMKTNPKKDQILFEPKTPLVSGKKYELFMAFRGHMKDQDIKANTRLKNGFFRRGYIKKDGSRKTYVYTILGSNSARAAFPCFNEPGFKSVFLVTIEHDNSLHAIINTPLDKKVPRGNGIVESIFEPTVNMSTYHVITIYGIIFWAREQAIDDIRSYLPVANVSVTSMEAYTGINYPYKELNIFCTQKIEFAFEAFGMIVTWERGAKWDYPLDDNKLFEYHARTVLPHEFAHMWFGGIFTIKDWDELWLYQGLTNFFQYHILDEYDGKTFKRETFIPRENHQYALQQDSAESTIPMNPKQRNTIEESRTYPYYLKPAALFYMLEKLFGEQRFQEGIRLYLKKYKFKNSNAAELWEVLQSLKPSFDVKTVMHDWEYQSGYPVISIKYVGKDTKGNKVYTATQSRYVDGLTPDDPKYKAKFSKDSWYVPFWYTDSSSPTAEPHLVWMNKTSVNITVPGCAKWIKGNAGQAGYYRVMYEQDMWDNLARQLDDYYKVFPASDRSSLSADAFEFWEDGKDFNITIPLTIASYLYKEKSTTPIRATVDYLHKIARKIRFQPELLNLYKTYLSSLLKESMLKKDWEDKYFKRKIFCDIFDLLAYVGESAAIKIGLDLVNNWIKTGKYDDEYIYVRRSAYQMAARYGNETHWEFLYQKYKDIANVNESVDIEEVQTSERTRVLAGLSATKSNTTINKWLNDTYLDSVSNKTDIWEKLEQVSQFSPGRELAWIYFKTNFATILERDAEANGNKTTSFLDFTKYFDKQCHLLEVEQFARSQPKIWTLKATNTSLKAIRNNIKWQKRNEHPLKDFLTNY